MNSKYFNLVIILTVMTSCSSKENNYSERLYSPLFPQKESVWMTKEEALAAPKVSGIVEVSQFVGFKQTTEQKQAADELYKKTLAYLSYKKLFDFDNAVEMGYRPVPSIDTLHYANNDYIFDGDFLNPEKPEYLMFYDTVDGPLLAGVMFIQDDVGVHGKQIGGPETVWHFHYYKDGDCVPVTTSDLRLRKNRVSREHCAEGEILLRESPEMLHLWFVDHPQGRFGSSMAIDVSAITDSELVRKETLKAKMKK